MKSEKLIPELPNVQWNVVGKDEYKARVGRLLDRISVVLANTLGPYGSTTMIQQMGKHDFTKDGFSVLKRFIFNDGIEDALGDLFLGTSRRIVRKVGDGSTSAILASNELYKAMEKLVDSSNKYRPRVIRSRINALSAEMCEVIEGISQPINRDGDYDDIYKLALISTNDNAELAALIQSAYQQVNSTNIRFTNSRVSEHSLEVIEGYQAPVWYNDPFYINSEENRTASVTDVDVLLFDHFVEYEYHYRFIMQAIVNAHETGKRLVIMAPQYDRVMHSEMQNILDRERSTLGNVFTIWTTVDNASLQHRAKYTDLAALLGAKMVKEHIINEYNKRFMPKDDRERMFNSRLQGEVNEDINVDFLHYMGHVGKIVIGDRQSLFTEFTHMDEEMHEKNKTVAQAAYNKQRDHDNAHDTPGTEIVPLHERLMALNLRVATIKVGGETNEERGANYDLVDDAVKASRAAYDSGYNIGGNLAIVHAARSVILSREHDELDLAILQAFEEAFCRVYGYVLGNAGIEDREEVEDYINKSLVDLKCYNLVTDSFDGDVINPTLTDIEILRATSSIVSLLITSNQYVSTQMVSNI